MISSNIIPRIKKLEAALRPIERRRRVRHVIDVGGTEEREAEIARMIAAGEAHEGDLFRCILSAAECRWGTPENLALRARGASRN